MMTRLVLLAPFVAVVLAAPALAAPPVNQTMTCPIGGQTFDYRPPVPAAPLGERPDGKPYGTAAPAPLPECPGNGLVLFKDYTADEAKLLTPLISSEQYRALRKTDTQYYRAYWLMRQMDVAPENYLWALLQASWQAEGQPGLRERYLAELAEVSAQVRPNPSDMNWIGMEGRAVNALRELGRFDEASARLGKVPVAQLDVPAPEDTSTFAGQAKVKRAWFAFFNKLKAAIARKDSSIEPFDMIPRRVAIGYCIDRVANLDEAQRAFCASNQTDVDEARAHRAKAGR